MNMNDNDDKHYDDNDDKHYETTMMMMMMMTMKTKKTIMMIMMMMRMRMIMMIMRSAAIRKPGHAVAVICHWEASLPQSPCSPIFLYE